MQNYPYTRQGTFGVCRRAALLGLSTRALRRSSFENCTTAVARSQGQRRIYCATLPRSPSTAASPWQRDRVVGQSSDHAASVGKGVVGDHPTTAIGPE